MPDLADLIAAEARALFAHLPAGEIGEDEPLEFTLYGGRLTVFVPRTGYSYTLDDGAALRFEPSPDERARVTRYARGRVQEGKACQSMMN